MTTHARVFYRCRECASEWSVILPSNDPRHDRACECGGAATFWLIQCGVPAEDQGQNPTPYAFVKGRPYEFDPKCAVMPQGRHHGVSDSRYKAHHRRWQNEAAREQREVDRGFAKGKSNVPRYIGGMSGEMVRAIGLQEKDPEAVSRDPEAFLKKTGRYVGE